MTKRSVIALLAVLALFIAVSAWVWHVNTQDDAADASSNTVLANPAQATSVQSTAAQIEYGAYLARVGNCSACHTARGGTANAGGRALDTPFGVVYSSNLTPDNETGLARWSSADFWRALHHGRGRDGRLLVPAFPYTNFTLISRADSDAIWAYFQTLAPVAQARPEHGLRFPYNTQLALAVWRALFFAARVAPVASASRTPLASPEWQRGAYLAQGLGHCSACHGARNVFGAVRGPDQGRRNFAGALMAESGWYAPALDAIGEGSVAAWTADETVQWFKIGVNAHASANGPMGQVVLTSTQHWTDADLRALTTYLSDLLGQGAERLAESSEPATGSALSRQAVPPIAVLQAPSSPVALRGALIYDKHCAECHGAQGEGARVEGGALWAYPPLAGNRAVMQPTAINLVRTVRSGGFAPATAGNPRPYGMPPFDLADEDMAAVLSYIRSAWGNRAAPVSAVDVRVGK